MTVNTNSKQSTCTPLRYYCSQPQCFYSACIPCNSAWIWTRPHICILWWNIQTLARLPRNVKAETGSPADNRQLSYSAFPNTSIASFVLMHTNRSTFCSCLRIPHKAPSWGTLALKVADSLNQNKYLRARIQIRTLGKHEDLETCECNSRKDDLTLCRLHLHTSIDSVAACWCGCGWVGVISGRRDN